ncbi:hypothetical protein NHQ30_009306 [Ciborinia camelliae]|nr:hypothetical protein NHQ30_009306 [Ciborinia camelliae]
MILAMFRKPKVYWATPLTLLLAFSTGVLLSLLHHLFYRHLDGSVAPTGEYHSMIGKVSKQQFNLAVGNALAFSVQSMFSLAVTISYEQVFWRALTTAKAGARLGDIDTAFSVLQDILGLFSTSLWRLKSMLFPMAVIFWLVLFMTILAWGSYSVSTTVPQFDFMNLNFANLVAPKGTFFEYNGPSKLVQRVAAATAAQGTILPIEPPALNASWSIDFWGPSIHCDYLSDSERAVVLRNYGSYLQTGGRAPFSYFSWASTKSILPFFNDTVLLSLSNTSTPIYPAATIIAFIEDDQLLSEFFSTHWKNAPVNANGGWLQMLKNMTTIRCDLFNSSYVLNFQYRDGNQVIGISKANTSQDIPILADANFTFPAGSRDTWNVTPCEISNYPAPICFDPMEAQRASYMGIMDAFNVLLVGWVNMGFQRTHTLITQTVLTDTIELQFLSNEAAVHTVFGNSTNFRSGPINRPLGSRGRLIDALEQLFENITISMLSEKYLLSDYSSPYSPPSLVNVTFETYHSIYTYDITTLWLAYGLGILFAGITVAIGFVAMWLNGVAYDAKFSTVLRMSRVDIGSMIIGQNKRAKRRNSKADSGGKPLPKSLAKAIIDIKSAPENGSM